MDHKSSFSEKAVADLVFLNNVSFKGVEDWFIIHEDDEDRTRLGAGPRDEVISLSSDLQDILEKEIPTSGSVDSKRLKAESLIKGQSALINRVKIVNDGTNVTPLVRFGSKNEPKTLNDIAVSVYDISKKIQDEKKWAFIVMDKKSPYYDSSISSLMVMDAALDEIISLSDKADYSSLKEASEGDGMEGEKKIVERTIEIELPLDELMKEFGYKSDADPFDDVYHDGYSRKDVLSGNWYMPSKFDGVEELFPSAVASAMEMSERYGWAAEIEKVGRSALESALEKIEFTSEYQDQDGEFVTVDAAIKSATIDAPANKVILKIKNPEHLLNGIVSGVGMFAFAVDSDQEASIGELKAGLLANLNDYFEVWGDRKPSGEVDSRFTPGRDDDLFSEELEFRIGEMEMSEIVSDILDAVESDRMDLVKAVDMASKFTGKSKADLKKAVKEEYKKLADKHQKKSDDVEVEESASHKGKWVIQDWAGNFPFEKNKHRSAGQLGGVVQTFDSFEDAEEFLSEFLGDKYEENREEYEIVPYKGVRDSKYLDPKDPRAGVKSEAKDEVKEILIALNSTGPSFDKYPFGNKELTSKVKELEAAGKIKYDDKFGKWLKAKGKMQESSDRVITEIQFEDIGLTSSSYFSGRGTIGTEFDEVFVGIGSTQKEAVKDALESAAQFAKFSDEVEKEADEAEAKADDKNFAGNDLTVTAHIQDGKVEDFHVDCYAELISDEKMEAENDVENGTGQVQFVFKTGSCRDRVDEISDYLSENGIEVPGEELKKLEKELSSIDNNSEHYYHFAVYAKLGGEMTEGKKSKKSLSDLAKETGLSLGQDGVLHYDDDRIDVFANLLSKEEYKDMENEIRKFSIVGDGYEVFAWNDEGGFDYWSDEGKEGESNYIQISVKVDENKIDKIDAKKLKSDVLKAKFNFESWDNKELFFEMKNSGEMTEGKKLSERHGLGLKENFPELDEKVKDLVETYFQDIERKYETFGGEIEEIEHESRDGFISSNDGGYQKNGFSTISYLTGTGSISNLPEKAEKAILKAEEYGNELTKEEFVRKYKEELEGIPEDKINYHDLYKMGKADLAEKLSEMEMENSSDENSTVMFQLRVMFHNEEEDGRSFTIQSAVNWEAPYHRPKSQWEAFYQKDVDFDGDIDKCVKEIEKELKNAVDFLGA